MAGKLLTALVLLLVTADASAGFYLDGNQLHAKLTASKKMQGGTPSLSDLGEAQNALGYINGVADTLNGTVVCAPNEVTDGQLVAVVSKYVDEHPEQWQVQANLLVGRALHQAFPCPSK